MRGREFTMKDAYSFDRDETAALRSYAVVSDKRTPRLDIHTFGLPGAASLNSAIEEHVLSMIEESGGFAGHAAFDPVQTAPVHRWPATAFTPAGSSADSPIAPPRITNFSYSLANLSAIRAAAVGSSE